MAYPSAAARGANANAYANAGRLVHDMPLNHIPALNENAVFIDLRVV